MNQAKSIAYWPYVIVTLKPSDDYDDAFEGVCSLRDIGAVKTQNSSPLYDELLSSLGDVVVSDLSWKDPIASQVISDDSELVKKLLKKLKRVFMEPARKMIPTSLPPIMEVLPEKLEHDKSWKEGDVILVEVTKGILSVLSDTWKNPAFSPEFIESQNEGTYVTNIIVPTIRAVLKDLPFGKSSYVSTDSGDVHRYFHLKSTKIPIQQAEEKDVTEFVETLLILRNILVVNMSLIFHAQVPRSRRRMEKSSNVSSDP
ncbi:9384_t:CDS:2, partial [Entrophospora sp. SA101]